MIAPGSVIETLPPDASGQASTGRWIVPPTARLSVTVPPAWKGRAARATRAHIAAAAEAAMAAIAQEADIEVAAASVVVASVAAAAAGVNERTGERSAMR